MALGVNLYNPFQVIHFALQFNLQKKTKKCWSLQVYPELLRYQVTRLVTVPVTGVLGYLERSRAL